MKFIAHRGACLECQEDTLASLMRGAEYGVFAVECDPRQTADGVYVLFHDVDLRRLAGDERKMSQLTYAEMKTALEKAGKELTTLDELLENYTGSSAVLFDMPRNATDEAFYKKLRNAPFKTMVGVHAVDEVKVARKFYDEKDILAFMPEEGVFLPRAFTDAGAGNVRLWEYWLTEHPISEVRKLIPQDREIWIMSADLSVNHPLYCMNGSRSQIERLTELGADALLLNDAALAKEFM